jgi:hypothetical protein
MSSFKLNNGNAESIVVHCESRATRDERYIGKDELGKGGGRNARYTAIYLRLVPWAVAKKPTLHRCCRSNGVKNEPFNEYNNFTVHKYRQGSAAGGRVTG